MGKRDAVILILVKERMLQITLRKIFLSLGILVFMVKQGKVYEQ